jgi:putative ABC transport system permease protein
VNLLRTVVGDVFFGLRMFARKPAFAAVSVLTLALGIAVNTAMFSVVYATLTVSGAGRAWSAAR